MSIDVDFENLPGHIAIIMDGNGRWAKKRFLTKKAGHSAGAQTLRTLSDEMNKLGFKILTVYAFSTENWKRSDEEVRDLMNILRDFIKKYISDVKKNNLRINVIGDLSRLDTDLRDSIKTLMGMTRQNKGLCVNLAINYGGRDDIVRAAQKISDNVLRGKLAANDINEELVNSYLDTAEFPDPDIIIRTGGEYRISNFLLWQCAYSELFFTDKLWPDIKIDDIVKISGEYRKRDRRFGGR